MILDYDTDFIITSSIGSDDLLKLIILTALVKKICKTKNGKPYFTPDDETAENHVVVNKFYDTVLKITPCRNKAQLTSSSKKVYSLIRHLCKNLSHLGIFFESKNILMKNDSEYITKYAHFIHGIDNIKL